MRIFLIFVLVLLSSACKTLEVDVKADQSCHVSYTGIGSIDISELSAEICGGSIGVGSASSGLVSDEIIACLIAPELCKDR